MAQQKQEQDLNQLLKVRRDKLADLQANGKDPFQITKFNQTHHSMEVKSLYEAHEAELLKDRAEVDVTGLDEEQAKEAVKKDYEERREIMDASPIHVSIAGRMMFKRRKDHENRTEGNPADRRLLSEPEEFRIRCAG